VSTGVERFRHMELNKTLLVLVSVAILTGIFMGYGTSLTPRDLLRGLVLFNVFLICYIVLLRDLVSGIVIYLYSLVFLNLYWRIIIPGAWPDLDIPRLMFVFLWLIFLLEVILGHRRLLPTGAIGTVMLIVMGAILLSMIMISHKRSTRPLLNAYVIPYAMFAVSKNIFTSRRAVDKFILWLSVPLAFYFPMTSIFEHFRINSLLFPRYIGQPVVGDMEVDWGGRASGTFINPAVTGLAMVGIYVMALYSLSKMKSAFARTYAFVISAITPVGVFFTYTRSVYVAFAGSLLILAVCSKRLRLVSIILLVAMGLAVLGNWSNMTSANREQGGVGDVTTAQSRMVILYASLQMIRDSPIVGCGFDRFVKEGAPYVAEVRQTVLGYKASWIAESCNQHNQFVSIFTEIGLMGFAPFVILYVLILRLLWKARKVEAEEYDREFVVMVWAVMAGYIAVIMFIEPRWYEFMNVLPFMLLGIISGGYERAMMRMRRGFQGRGFQGEKEYAA